MICLEQASSLCSACCRPGHQQVAQLLFVGYLVNELRALKYPQRVVAPAQASKPQSHHVWVGQGSPCIKLQIQKARFA